MGSRPDGVPPWLLATLDQLDAAADEFTVRSRIGFEQMVRGHAHTEGDVAEAMVWYDTTQGHLDAAVASVLSGPEAVVAAPAPTVLPEGTGCQPGPANGDEDLVPSPRIRIPQPDFDMPDAPDRTTRLLQTPGVYLKGLAIGAALGGVVYVVLTGLLHWWFGAAWWGWWPSLLTVPVALVALMVWMTTVHDDIQHWIKKGGLKPMRKRVKL